MSHTIWPREVTKVFFIAHCQNSRILRTHKATRDINQANSHEETSDNHQDANSQLNVTLHSLGDLNHSFWLSLIHIFLVVARRAQCLSFWLVNWAASVFHGSKTQEIYLVLDFKIFVSGGPAISSKSSLWGPVSDVAVIWGKILNTEKEKQEHDM